MTDEKSSKLHTALVRRPTLSYSQETPHTARHRNTQPAQRPTTSSVRQLTADEETRSVHRAALDLLGDSEGEASG